MVKANWGVFLGVALDDIDVGVGGRVVIGHGSYCSPVLVPVDAAKGNVTVSSQTQLLPFSPSLRVHTRGLPVRATRPPCKRFLLVLSIATSPHENSAYSVTNISLGRHLQQLEPSSAPSYCLYTFQILRARASSIPPQRTTVLPPLL